MYSILVVDDEPNYLIVLSELLRDEGFEVFTAPSGNEAVDIVREVDLDLVLSDMQMPGMDGMQLLQEVKDINNELPVIIITAYAEIEKAVSCMQGGAFSYLAKPFSNDELLVNINKAIAHYTLFRENLRLRKEVHSQTNFSGMIGKNVRMLQVYELIEKVAPTPASVLISGESGTGKELVATAIHINSPRESQPFITVNCAALAENLLESELFGHEKGAFTDAHEARQGKFELASGGTLFLDEIGDLSLAGQAKLLRVLEEKVVVRVGDSIPIPTDARVIAATNQNLAEMVKEKRFREDLFFRLNVVTLELPPLRDRVDDVMLLAEHFMNDFTLNCYWAHNCCGAQHKTEVADVRPDDIPESEPCRSFERANHVDNQLRRTRAEPNDRKTNNPWGDSESRRNLGGATDQQRSAADQQGDTENDTYKGQHG